MQLGPLQVDIIVNVEFLIPFLRIGAESHVIHRLDGTVQRNLESEMACPGSCLPHPFPLKIAAD